MFHIGFGTVLLLSIVVYLIEQSNNAREDREGAREVERQMNAARKRARQRASNSKYPSWMTTSWKEDAEDR